MSNQPFDQDEQVTTGDVAKQEAAHVTQDTKEAGRQVAQTTGEEAKAVVGEAKSQVASLYDGVRADLTQQAGTQQDRAAEALRGFAGELGRMADGAEQDGMARGLVSQAGERLDGVASWLADRRPEDVLDEARRYARRNPGTFLAVCALVGLVGGRLTRGLRDDQHQDHGSSDRLPVPVTGTPPPYPVEPGVVGVPGSYGGRPSAGVPGSPDTELVEEHLPPAPGTGALGYDVPPVPGGDPRTDDGTMRP